MAVDDLPVDDLTLPFAWCAPCGRDVLTGVAGDDGQGRICVHCGAAISGAVRHVRGTELSESGYALYEEAGCGRPDCGRGRCGTHPGSR
jgi:hypothetical protein